MNYLVSMLLTQCFQQLYLRSDERYNGRLPVPVRVIQDEWANVAQPDSYPKVLATCRSYNIGINIIVQNIHSIKALYKDEWESVIGNCDTLLFLGGGNELVNALYTLPLSLQLFALLLVGKFLFTLSVTAAAFPAVSFADVGLRRPDRWYGGNYFHSDGLISSYYLSNIVVISMAAFFAAPFSHRLQGLFSLWR